MHAATINTKDVLSSYSVLFLLEEKLILLVLSEDHLCRSESIQIGTSPVVY